GGVIGDCLRSKREGVAVAVVGDAGVAGVGGRGELVGVVVAVGGGGAVVDERRAVCVEAGGGVNTAAACAREVVGERVGGTCRLDGVARAAPGVCVDTR